MENCKCSFCGELILNDEVVCSEDCPECALCFNCVEQLHHFYSQVVVPHRSFGATPVKSRTEAAAKRRPRL